MRKKQPKQAAKEKTIKKLFLDRYYLPIIALSLIVLFGAIALFNVLKPSKTLPNTSLNNELQNIRLNKIPINAEIKPNTYIYYVLLKPANISENFKIYAYLTSDDSFDFYMFEKKEDIKNISVKPIKTFLIMKNLNKTIPIKEGNVLVLANSRDKNIKVEGFVEYLER